MTAAAVSAQDEFQTGLAAAEPQLCMNLQLPRNSLALIAGWCCLGRVLPADAVPFNLRSYQAAVANDHAWRKLRPNVLFQLRT